MFDYGKVDTAVGRIADAVGPSRIILFGSAARGDARDGSDLDLLVLFDHDFDEKDMYVRVKRQFIGLRLASDIILMTEEDFGRYSEDRQSFSYEIAATGKIVYPHRAERTSTIFRTFRRQGIRTRRILPSCGSCP